MDATKFEFEHRFWIIWRIYVIAFCLGALDPVSMVAALQHWIEASVSAESPETANFARVVIAGGALLVFGAAALRTWGAAYLRTEIEL